MKVNERRKKAVRCAMFHILSVSISQERYDGLQWMCETVHIDNKKLVNRLNRDRSISQLPAKTIFTDMAYLLYEESENNHKVIEYCYEYYSKKYPNAVLELEQAEKSYVENKKIYDKFKNSIIKSSDDVLSAFGLFLLFGSEVIEDEKVYGYSSQEYIVTTEYALIGTDIDCLEIAPKFNTGDPIWESKQYAIFLDKKKEELAEFLQEILDNKNITKNNLCKVLGNELKSKAGELRTEKPPTLESIVRWSSTQMLLKHHGAVSWMEEVTNDGKTGYGGSLNYKPDLEYIIDNYYKEVVKFHVKKSLEETGESISKLFLTRYCESVAIHIDYVAIMYLYYIDVICKLFDDVMEQYYEYFSWEKVVDKKESERYKEIISAIEKDKQKIESKLLSALEKNSELQKVNREEDAKKIIPYEKKIIELNKTIEDKNKEIENLKRQLDSQAEYIKIISENEETSEDSIVDIEELQKKRYLFVGRAKEALPQLYNQFSNSLFMESENYDLKNIKVDGIVMLIKYMSHAMFYKINSASALSDIPVIMCNSKNINMICSKMRELIKEK